MANSTTNAETSGTASSMAMGAHPSNVGIGGVFSSIAPLLLMLIAFYFLLMRPQQKRDAKRRKMVESVKRGDKVVLTSGIIGTIHKVISDKEISLEISEETRIRVLKNSISDIVDKTADLGKIDEEEIKGKNSELRNKTSRLSKKKKTS